MCGSEYEQLYKSIDSVLDRESDDGENEDL